MTNKWQEYGEKCTVLNQNVGIYFVEKLYFRVILDRKKAIYVNNSLTFMTLIISSFGKTFRIKYHGK